MGNTFDIEKPNATRTEIIDGRVILICSDGTRQPLRKQEAMWLALGLYSLEFLDKKYNSEPTRAY